MLALLLLVSTCARADVFGSGAPVPASLVDRLAAMEKELKELKEKGVTAGPGAAAQGKDAGSKPNLALPPPLPGLEGLPGGGADERERLLVEKELTYEVVGTVNGLLLVREGDRRFLLSEKDFKAFEKEKRQKVVRKLKVQAVSDGDAAKLAFPQLQPPEPPAIDTSGGTASTSAATSPAKPAAAAPAAPANVAAPATIPGRARPASPVKKNLANAQ